MLSDRFIEKNSQDFKNDINTKILRLEHLSISMAKLIASGNSDKIMHLEKIRKKILIDILKEKQTLSKENKSQIKNIITLNSELIEIKVENFYQTCSITRASNNMANCAKELLIPHSESQ